MHRNLFVLVGKVLIIFVWAGFLLTLLGTYLPKNSFTPSGKIQLYVKSFFPEGWGFFSKNPRDADVYIYSVKDGDFMLKTPSSSFENLLGLKRDARAQGAEYGILLKQLSADKVQWYECKNISHLDCFTANRGVFAIQLQNPSYTPTLCGELWIVLQAQVPWAWSGRQTYMPLKFLKIKVSCDAKPQDI
jgi:sporulation delaying protein A